jgi:hypothetical protein
VAIALLILWELRVEGCRRWPTCGRGGGAVRVAVGVQRGMTCARTPDRSSNAADESIVITILAVAAAVAAIIRSYAPRVLPWARDRSPQSSYPHE